MRGLSRSRRPTCVRIEGLSCCPRLPTRPGESKGRRHPAPGQHSFLCAQRHGRQVLPWPIRPEVIVSCECLTPISTVSGFYWTWFLALQGTAPRLTFHPAQQSCPLTHRSFYLPPRASHQPGQREGAFSVMSTSSC